MSRSIETKILYDWKLKLGILVAIASPAITGTAAYYKLKIDINDVSRVSDSRSTEVELNTEKNYASKNAVEKVQSDISQMKQDLVEIKTILQRKLK